MRLSRRLETILSMVPPGLSTADIGTDHGLVAAELISRGICPRVIATDLREGPLSAARALVKERGLQEKIDLRLGDGLAPLEPGEVQVILMAGMGGALVKSHGNDTAPRAALLNEQFPELFFAGGIVLNRQAGGLNPFAVRACG